MSASPRQIFEAALAATRRGYTVIPFNVADKLPLVAWGVFQETQPIEDDVKSWFNAGLFAEGFAFLTGNASRRLLVLDFDDLGKAFEFETQFQDLAKTYRVTTSRGVHYYFYADSGFEPCKRQLKGLDILWNCPVIAPPAEGKSAANPHVSPLAISQAELNSVIRHFETQQANSASPDAPEQMTIGMNEIVGAFRRSMEKDSRNNSLFSALCLARDTGHSKYECITSGLMDVFVFAPSPRGHTAETNRRREREFMRTLESVYKRAPRNLQDTEPRFLSDDARQKLIQLGLVGVARLLDALAHHFAPGAIVTRRQIIQACKGIARDVIDTALKAVFGAKLIFSRVFPSPAPHPNNALEKGLNKDALYGRKKTGKSIGRPEIAFRIPSPALIQRITGAVYRSSTTIEFEQTDSVADYRATLTKGTLDRERERHFQGFLGRLVGVTARTIRHYIKLINYDSIPQDQLISMVTWENVNALFESGQVWGGAYFLKDHTGQQAPANLGAALWMLKARKAVRLLRQIGSIYVPKEQKEKYESQGFKADLEALFEAFHTKESMNVKKYETPKKWGLDQELARELAIEEYWQSIKAQTQTAAPEAAEEIKENIKLTRAAIRSVREDAAALCLLMPKKLLSHENAARLLLQYGTERVMQCATKAVMDYHFSQHSKDPKKRPIKNVVAVIISRLKKGWKQAEEKPRPLFEDNHFVTHQNLGDALGVNKGVFDTGERLGY